MAAAQDPSAGYGAEDPSQQYGDDQGQEGEEGGEYEEEGEEEDYQEEDQEGSKDAGSGGQYGQQNGAPTKPAAGGKSQASGAMVKSGKGGAMTHSGGQGGQMQKGGQPDWTKTNSEGHHAANDGAPIMGPHGHMVFASHLPHGTHQQAVHAMHDVYNHGWDSSHTKSLGHVTTIVFAYFGKWAGFC